MTDRIDTAAERPRRATRVNLTRQTVIVLLDALDAQDAEIERAVLDEYIRADPVAALRAENQRLRGALEDIHDGEPEWPDDPQKELDWCRKRARAALSGEDET